MWFWHIGCVGLALLSGTLGFTGISAGRFEALDPSIAQSLSFTFFAIFLAMLALDLLSSRVRHRTIRPARRSGGPTTRDR